MANYPGSAPAVSTALADATVNLTTHKNHHNQLADEVNAIGADLVAARGSSTTMAAKVATMIPKPAAPATNDLLTWSGAAWASAKLTDAMIASGAAIAVNKLGVGIGNEGRFVGVSGGAMALVPAPSGGGGGVPAALTGWYDVVGSYSATRYTTRAAASTGTDATGPIQTALDAAAAAGGGVVYIPPGWYRITTGLTAVNNVRIIGGGRGLTTLLCDDVATTLIDYRGAIGYFSNHAFAAATSLAKGARSVALADVTGMAVGDWVMVDDNEIIATVNRETWITRIVDISGTTVYFGERAPRAYLTANSPIVHGISGGPRVGTFVSDLGFEVNVGFDVPSASRSLAIMVGSAISPVIERCEFRNFTGASGAVYIERCRDALVSQCTFYRIIDPAGAPTTAAAVNLIECTKCQVRNCQTTRGGFGLTCYKSPWTSFVGNDIGGGTDVYSVAIPTDDGGRGIKITSSAFTRIVGNSVSDFSYNGIITHDSEGVLVANNTVTNCRDQGILNVPSDGSLNNTATVDVAIVGNVIDNVWATIAGVGNLGTGILSAGSRTLIANNIITNCTGDGIYVQGHDTIIEGNLVDTCGGGSGSSGGAIELASSVARCLIMGNTTRSSATAYAIWTQNGNGTSTVALNHVDKAVSLHASDTVAFFSTRQP